MTTVSTELPVMSITETILENSLADLAIEFYSQSDYTTLPEPEEPMHELSSLAQHRSSEEETSFVPGEFEYVKDKSSRDMLQNAYQAVNQTETWSFVKKDIESFSFSRAPEIDIITYKMVELGYKGHSGFSFGWTMRQMQIIAREGEKKYKLMVQQW